MQFVLLLLLRAAIFALNLLPLKFRIGVITFVIHCVTLIIPRFRKTAFVNLKLVFPERDLEFHKSILRRSYAELARVFVDFARLPKLDRAWADAHIKCSFLPRFLELKRQNPHKGVLIATGHLGSFELLAHYIAAQGYPISFIVRAFKLPKIDQWWRSVREAKGNRVISRKGAFKKIISEIGEGRDVGILFDQNVTRNHAEFVNWFGVPAATTRALAITALRTEAPVIVASIFYEHSDQYCIEVKECDFSKLYQDKISSYEQKIFKITEECSQSLQEMIRKKPEAWFWMHRRWKTRPEEESAGVY